MKEIPYHGISWLHFWVGCEFPCGNRNVMQHTATKAWLMVAKDRRNLNIRMVREKGEFKRERERQKWVKEKNTWDFGTLACRGPSHVKGGEKGEGRAGPGERKGGQLSLVIQTCTAHLGLTLMSLQTWNPMDLLMYPSRQRLQTAKRFSP